MEKYSMKYTKIILQACSYLSAPTIQCVYVLLLFWKIIYGASILLQAKTMQNELLMLSRYTWSTYASICAHGYDSKSRLCLKTTLIIMATKVRLMPAEAKNITYSFHWLCSHWNQITLFKSVKFKENMKI